MTEEEVVGWHHRLDGHEFEQAPGDFEGSGSLVFFGRNDAKAETPVLQPPHVKS